jgi:hypothetical protein
MQTTKKTRARRASSAQKPTATAAADYQPAALKIRPAARYLGGLSVPTMHRLIRRGELTPLRKIHTLLFTIEELDRFLKT